MKKHHLKEFCKQNSQSMAAKIMGCTQGNVSQAIAAQREIYIEETSDGYTFYEVKRPSRHKTGQIGADTEPTGSAA